jgi:DMSO reductase family type II enzyme chaperone
MSPTPPPETTDAPGTGAPETTDRVPVEEVDAAAAARGGVYALLASLFDEPNESLYDRLATGRVDDTCRRLLATTGLAVDPVELTVAEERDRLCARFNSLFTVGHAGYADRTDGTLDAQGPPVPLYESSHRDVPWRDLNVDLARAYDYFGLEVDTDRREHHDHLRYQLEFAGYLARRQAAARTDVAAPQTGNDDAGTGEGTATGPAALARARRDFLDRHLVPFADGVAERTADEPGTGLYGEAASLLDRFVRADREDLRDRFDGGDAP